MRIIKCEYCGKEFTPKRSTAKFCSSSCRTQNWHEKSESKKSQESQSPPPLKNMVKEELSIKNKNKVTPQQSKEIDNLDTDKMILLNNLEGWKKKCNKAVAALINHANHSISLNNLMFGTFPLETLNNEPYDNFKERLDEGMINYFDKFPINRLTHKIILKFQQLLQAEVQLATKNIKRIHQN